MASSYSIVYYPGNLRESYPWHFSEVTWRSFASVVHSFVEVAYSFTYRKNKDLRSCREAPTCPDMENRTLHKNGHVAKSILPGNERASRRSLRLGPGIMHGNHTLGPYPGAERSRGAIGQCTFESNPSNEANTRHGSLAPEGAPCSITSR